ncbi:MAG: hypothetical protein HY905_25170 [Deltaproteobacteria bacterium]|nr:hypothetical protein [Deltaproteobacteria bacterium]
MMPRRRTAWTLLAATFVAGAAILAVATGWWSPSAAFGAGFVTALTPCARPMVPLTLALFGRTDGTTRASGRAALLYFVGLVGAFTVAGLAIGLTGGMLGMIAAHPATASPEPQAG